jgi:hypothetical protein
LLLEPCGEDWAQKPVVGVGEEQGGARMSKVVMRYQKLLGAFSIIP